MKNPIAIIFYFQILILLGIAGNDNLLNGQESTKREEKKTGKVEEKIKGKEMVLDLGNDVKLTLVKIPGGKFKMGSPKDEAKRRDNEELHEVELSDYYMGKYAVTVKQYGQFVKDSGYDAGERWKDPGFEQGEDHPVVCVSWADAQAFCKWLSKKSGKKIGLPSEAQWEYACRAGTTTPFHFGSKLNGDQANCDGNLPYGTATKGNYLGKTSKVGSYPGNDWGLYDMHGNVLQWCEDYYGEYSVIKDKKDPILTKNKH